MGSPGLRFGRFERILVALAIAVAVAWLLSPLAGSLQALWRFLLALLLILGGFVLTRRLIGTARRVARRVLWRVRHRMVAVFFFVGVLPISLGALLVVWGAFLLLGPLTEYVVSTQFARYAERMQAMAEPLLWQLRDLPASARPGALERFLADAGARFPELAIQADFGGVRQSLRRDWSWPDSRLAMPADLGGGRQSWPEGLLAEAMPSKVLEGQPLVRRDGRVLIAVAARDEQSGGQVALVAPVTSRLVQELMPGLGILAVQFDRQPPEGEREARLRFRPSARGGALLATARSSLLARSARAQAEGQAGLLLAGSALPPPRSPLDWQIRWPIQTSVVDWRTNRIDSGVYWLRTRPSALWSTVFAQESGSMFNWFFVIGLVLMAAFGVNLLISMLTAISLTRTLTGAVNDLHVGTQHVNRGDFRYRIPVTGHDQISDLSKAFNAMTASIERLIEDSKQRQQLEAELEIAREVQARLFPARPPQSPGLQLLGVCRPARSVSGDFFDYVRLNERLLAVSFGDVSGKGISAALVMATLHSIVRTQLSLLHADRPRPLQEAAALLVERANRQLCEGTAPEKYSTLFFAAYDETAGRLVYANAGHLPPLLLRAGSVRPLEVTGMIVGTFPEAPYAATAIDLEPGDLLVAFTDGVTEPENEREQEYGLERLQEVLRREAERPLSELIQFVMDDVVAWTGGTALQDDMTMLVARKL